MKIFRPKRNEVAFFEMVAAAPWGGYGDALVHGYPAVLEQPEDTYHLERAGPFCIPLSKPESGILVVVDAVKQVLADELGITKFIRVVLDTVVRVDWEHWDPDERPEIVAPTGEPEDYFTAFDHDPTALAEMPELWSPRLSVGAAGEYVWPSDDIYDVSHLLEKKTESRFRINSASWNGQQIFNVGDSSGPFVTQFGKEVLSAYASEYSEDWESWKTWIEFLPCTTVE